MLEETWGRERLAATVYDFGVQNPLIGRVAFVAFWGSDIRKLYASINLIGSMPAGTRVLDVPCGGGLVFNRMKSGHGLHYTALDYSPVMLVRAGKKSADLGLDGINFQQGDVGALPFDKNTFDLCLTYNGIHCFPDPALAMHELARVLKPGGVLRGTLVVRGAGVRYDAMFSFLQRRGYFGPGCTRDELFHWCAAAGLDLRSDERSGAIVLFEAVKRD